MLKILIAEDEEISLKHLKYALEKEGYKVTGVGNGLEALNKMKGETFDILIADIKMPVMDGLTLLAEAKEHYSDTEVMIVTGFGSIESAVNAMKQGASEYITKPFDMEELMEKVRSYLGGGG